MAGYPSLSRTRKHILIAFDESATSIADHLNSSEAPNVASAHAELLTHHSELRKTLERALGFAQWLEERAQTVRKRTDQQPGRGEFNSFFSAVFGEPNGPGGDMRERIDRDLRNVHEQMQAIDAAASSVLMGLMEADAATLALIAQRDESAIVRLLTYLVDMANGSTVALCGMVEGRGVCTPEA